MGKDLVAAVAGLCDDETRERALDGHRRIFGNGLVLVRIQCRSINYEENWQQYLYLISKHTDRVSSEFVEDFDCKVSY